MRATLEERATACNQVRGQARAASACFRLAFPPDAAEERTMWMSAAFLVSALVQFGLGLLLAAMLGPVEFGLYAIGFAAAVLVQTLLFEAIRLAITRFAGQAGPLPMVLRIGLALPVVLAVLGLAFILIRGGDRAFLLAAGILTALVAGLAECRAAWLRAHFAETAYAMLLLFRTGLSLLLLPSAAWLTQRADAVLAAFALSILLAVVLHRAFFAKPEAKAGADYPHPLAMLAYAVPIVGTNLAYLGLLLALRLFMAQEAGLAEAGRFSLALDLVGKLVMTLGTALDLWLFQLAVRADREGGAIAGQQQLTRNFAQVLALLAPALLGLWLVLPSLEALLVAREFRGAFAWHAAMLIPGLALYGIVQYALHPFHQIARRTAILLVTALAALLVTLLILTLAPAFRLPSVVVPALALVVAMALATAVLIGWRDRAVPILASGTAMQLSLALATMTAAVLPIRFLLEPGPVALVASVVIGMIAYGALAWSLDLAGLRGLLRPKTTNGASPPRPDA